MWQQFLVELRIKRLERELGRKVHRFVSISERKFKNFHEIFNKPSSTMTANINTNKRIVL